MAAVVLVMKLLLQSQDNYKKKMYLELYDFISRHQQYGTLHNTY